MIVLSFLWVACALFLIGVDGCPYYLEPGEIANCAIWLQELGASKVDSKNNVMYDDRLYCARLLVGECGAKMKINKEGQLLKVFVQYSTNIYYIYTDEQSAIQKLGYLGDDD